MNEIKLKILTKIKKKFSVDRKGNSNEKNMKNGMKK